MIQDTSAFPETDFTSAIDSIRLLIIEDNPADQFLLETLLEETSIDIAQHLEASSITEALKTINTNSVDLILLDLSLPDTFRLDGLTEIRKVSGYIPVIVLTGLDDDLVALDAIKQGAQDYLVKGKYSSIELERSIRYACERVKGQRLLEENERYFRLLTENSNDLTFQLDEVGIILYVSNLSSITLETPPAELIGKNFIHLFHESDQAKGVDFLSSWKSEETVKGPVTFKVSLKSGEIRWIEATAKNMLGDPVIDGFIVNARDTTEQTKANELLLQNHTEALQYQSLLLSSQLNPHFIFNSLNSIQFYILENNPKPALSFLSNFSSLMRSVLKNSTMKLIRLKDELKFLKLYLDLELTRSIDRFSYEVHVNETINTEELLIPPMLIQPYLENTVIHGVGNLSEGGKISVEFIIENEQLICEITDNGVGRVEAQRQKFLRDGNKHKSQSSSILNRRLKVLNELEDGGYDCKIIDRLDEEGNALGTTVKVFIPIIQEEN